MTGTQNRQARKDNYYLGIAEAVASKSTCIRRAYGAVIVKDDEIVATGYNGSPRGCINCTETGCVREQLGIMKGDSYNLCTSVHAEMNAIISASRQEMIGATMYIVGLNNIPALMSTDPYADPHPCLLCHRMIVNSGIKRVVGRVLEKDEAATVHHTVDKELDVTATTFMERLDDLYERTLTQMETVATEALVAAERQKNLGADTPEVRKQIQELSDQKEQVKSARQVLLERKKLITASQIGHDNWCAQSSAVREIADIAEKYNIPITAPTGDETAVKGDEENGSGNS